MLRRVSPRWIWTALGFGFAVLAACEGSDDGTAWMSRIDDARGLAELSIPGTHNTGAGYELYPGTSKCQNLTIADQLAAGVRYLDVRCRHFQDTFLIFHGSIDQNQTFDEVLATMYAFLDAHPAEALIVSIMEESRPFEVTRSFDATFAAYVARDPDRWYLASTLPRLGDVRGKLVLLRRFPTTMAPLGIDASPWPENTAAFSITNDASLRIQDAFIVSDNAIKWAAITSLLAEARTGNASTLYLDHTSGYQEISGLNSIPTVSDDINARLDGFLADPVNRHAHLGVVSMDFVTPARAQAIVSTNEP